MKTQIVSLFIAAFTTFAALGDSTTIANSKLKLEFGDSGRLISLIDIPRDHEFISLGERDLWALKFVGMEDGLTPRTAQQRITYSRSNKATFTWSGFRLTNAPDLRVVVTVKLDRKEPLSRWHIEVENLSGLRLAKVDFPRVGNIAPQSNEHLAVPVWMGQVTSNPREQLNAGGQGRRRDYDYPGHTSMQCLAWYSKAGPGLYFSCDDTNSFHKNFSFFGDGKGGAGYEMIHLPENNPVAARNYSLPYQAVIGTFTGDWFTAVEMYRGWATNQYWAKQSRLANDRLPEWAGNTALWVWNRGRSTNVIGPAVTLQKELGLPVSVFWHWWHGCPYDIGFPEYLPPREGNESFKAALDTAHQNNVHAIVYMNQRLWGMTTKSWMEQGAEKYAVKAADGKVRPEVYNTFTRQACASMCMHTDFWRNTYAGIATSAIKDLGVDGIYMDQACSSLACYDPLHGHPLGGGTYWMNGFRLLSTDIRNRTTQGGATGLFRKNTSRVVGGYNDRVALAGEGVGESWLPYLDLMLSLQVSRDRYAAPDGSEPIPMFQAVYHPFAIQYGNYSSLTMPPYDDLWPAESAPKEPLKLLDRKFSQQFYLEQARAFVWGQQPTIANFLPSHLRERQEEMAYVLQLAKLRDAGKKYLLHGTFLRPPNLETSARTIDFSRLSIYAGQLGALSTFRKEVPLAIASTWRAKDGNVGIALASIADEPQTVAISFDVQDYRVQPGPVWRRTSRARERIGVVERGERTVILRLELPARDAALLEFTGRSRE